MAVLILKNIRSEGPGTIGDFLAENSVPSRTVELGEGEAPPSLDGFDALVVLGGPMGVYEMDAYPHLAVGARLIGEAIDRGMRVLGICLGAQLTAHSLGARVYKGESGQEVGWLPIELTSEGVKDPLMRKLAVHPGVGDFWRRFNVFHWHGDTFDIPKGAVRLASSALYENQAFRHGERVYAFQFHIEVTKDMLAEWFRPPEAAEMAEGKSILADRWLGECRGRAYNFFSSFFTGALGVRRTAETIAK